MKGGTIVDATKKTLEPELLSLRQLDQLFGLKRATVYKMMARGDFPRPLQVTRGLVRWPRKDVQDCIEKLPRSVGYGEPRSKKLQGAAA